MTGGILVACIGNVFLGDDGFGAAVARELSDARLPDDAQVVDYGIRGMHLACELLNGDYATLLLVDSLPGEDAAGCLRLLRVEPDELHAVGGIDAHSMTPAAVLAFLEALGGTLPRTFVLGCRPATVAPGIGLSAPVSLAVRHAARMVRDVLETELSPEGANPGPVECPGVPRQSRRA